MTVTQSGSVRVNVSFVRVDPSVQVHSSLQVSLFIYPHLFLLGFCYSQSANFFFFFFFGSRHAMLNLSYFGRKASAYPSSTVLFDGCYVH